MSLAWHGEVRQGKARSGMAGNSFINLAWRGTAWPGLERRGPVGQGFK